MIDRIQARSENGYLKFFDIATGRTIDIKTGGPSVIDHMYQASQAQWNTAIVNGSSHAYAGGILTITTGAANDDDHEMTSDLMFDPSKGLTAEARIAIGTQATSGFNFGFSDALTEAADKLAITFATASATTNATDAALFFHDSDATTNRVRAMGVNGDTDGTIITASSAALVDAAFHHYRVEVDPSGNAKFYYDDVLAGTQLLAVDTGATLCAYFGLITRTAAAKTAQIDYMHAWQWTA